MTEDTAAETPAAREAGPEEKTDAKPRKRRRKRKTSRELRDLQKMEDGMSKAALRLSRAVTEGLEVYRRERERSAAGKRDGAVRDWPRNTAKALSKTMRAASDVPVDMAEAVDTKTARRTLRLGARVLLWPLGR